MKSLKIIVMVGLALITISAAHADESGTVIIKINPSIKTEHLNVALFKIAIMTKDHKPPIKGKRNDDGNFVFEQIDPGWYELGYLIRISGFAAPGYRGPYSPSSTYTIRRPIQVKVNQTTHATLGFDGFDVTGRFLMPKNSKYADLPLGVLNGTKAFHTHDPEIEMKLPENYDQMTPKEQSESRNKWYHSQEFMDKCMTQRTQTNHRHYAFPVNHDGTFVIKNVIPGTYRFWVDFEKLQNDPMNRYLDIAGYYQKDIVIPEPDEMDKDKPYDLGDMMLINYDRLEIGQKAPDFTITTIDGKSLHLADLQGQNVLIHFWSSLGTSGLSEIQEVTKKYTPDTLTIISLNVDKVQKDMKTFLENQKIPGSIAWLGDPYEAKIFNDYHTFLPSYFLIDKNGNIVAGYHFGGNRLMKAVKKLVSESQDAN